jgi:hypothetical protein
MVNIESANKPYLRKELDYCGEAAGIYSYEL